MSSHIDQENIIEKIDWNQFSLEKLKLLQSQISKTINFKIENSELAINTKKIDRKYAYKASPKQIFPKNLQDSLSNYQRCILGVSLGSNNFLYSERIEACIKWISQNFTACVVLVGDSVYRLTVEVRERLKGNEARLEAFQTGQEFINKNSMLFEQYSESCSFEFRLASQIEKQSDFKIYYEELQGLYGKNESFQSLVNSFAQIYLNRGKEVELEEADEFGQKHLATTYLLEESALFTCLVKEGWSVIVYPGSIKTFEEISEGLHPEVPLPLQQMLWVSLRLQPKTTSGNENIEEKITR